MSVAWTIRIAEQKDFLTKMLAGEAANVETSRRQGQIKGYVSRLIVAEVPILRFIGMKSETWVSE